MFDSPGAVTVLISAVAAVAVIILAAAGSLLLGPNARRNRAFARAQLLLRQGQWRPALDVALRLRQPTLSPQWQGKLNNLEGECRLAAAAEALKERRYEEALDEFNTASGLLVVNADELHARVLETMLSEVRRLYAEGSPESLRTAAETAGRAAKLGNAAEASFWRGLCLLRTGDEDEAALALAEAHQAGQQRYLDPPLYLGALRLRQGKPQEALRYLSEANRADASCPVVPWQLGLALVAAGGDGRMALQALARALGPRGLGVWANPSGNGAATSAQRLWAEGMPEGRSFVRRLAQQHRFVCPLLGDDLRAMIRQGQLAMAQAHMRMGNFQAAADIYTQLMQDSPPTLGLLRGLGLALARLERYDQAFKHLRAALDMDPRDQFTAGYLALCGAQGKPHQADDKPKNVLWAVRLLARFKVKEDPEWARIVGVVLAEARAAGVEVTPEELTTLCDALASAAATDVNAAAAYDQLAGAVPEALRPLHGWLFARAAQQHGVGGAHELELFAVAFRDADGLGRLYAERGWDAAEAEYCYLQRASQKQPGRFPEALGPDYPPRGTAFLRDRSRQAEAAGKADEALAAAEVLARLAPDDVDAHDRLAYLCHRRGDLDRAAAHLAECCRLRPDDHRPLLRLAAVEQQRGRTEARRDAVRRALALTTGAELARAALLGSRLALQSALASGGREPPEGPLRGQEGDLDEAATLLEACLKSDPAHADAAWQLAAVRCLQNDRAALAELSPRLERADADDARYRHLAAICHLLADDAAAALAAARQAASDETLTADSRYLEGLAAVRQGDLASAASALQAAAESTAASAEHARALLGVVRFRQGQYEHAVAAWAALPAERRAARKLDEPLRATAFLAAAASNRAGRFARAAQQLREAGKLGCRDRRLGPLLQRSLFEAGRQLLFPPKKEAESPESDSVDLTATARLAGDEIPAVLPLDPEAEAAADYLEQAVKVGCPDPDVHYFLGLAYRRAERPADARAALRRAPRPEGRVFLQLGLLSLQEGQLAQAEQEFARARELDPSCFAACCDLLLTRLSLDKVAEAEEVVEPAVAVAPTEEDRRFLTLLGMLLRSTLSPLDDRAVDPGLLEMTAAEEERLLKLVRGLGQVETSLGLLKALMTARRKSQPVQDAFFEAVLVQGKALVDRCLWGEAERLLGPWASRRTLPRDYQRSLRNLLGCCAVLNQDFAGGLRHFQAAVTLADPPGDPRLVQNIALTLEIQGEHGAAEPYWSRCFDLLEHQAGAPSSPGQAEFARRVLYRALVRQVGRHFDQEKWQAAVPFAERAHPVRPGDVELLERMFQIYQHLYRADAARWALARLRSAKPDDPVYELYEIDLLPVKGLKDAERMLAEVERVVQAHGGNARVEERAQAMALSLKSLLTGRYDALSEDAERVRRHVRGRPTHQVDWRWVDDEAEELRDELTRLRRVVVKCETLVRRPDHRRALQELAARIDRKISLCDSLAD